ncbi:MAG: hypothetical protein ACO1TE_05345 [Prosthecobacter sp.]
MTHAQDFTPPPSWLPLRVLCSSVVAAGTLLALGDTGPWSERLSWEMPAPGLWSRCGASLLILTVALLLALCLGLALGFAARRLGARMEAMAAFCGRAIACLPVAVIAWGFVGLWTGKHGLPVETLMPAELPLLHNVWQVTLARTVWEFLVPALLLALPLAGEVLHAVVTDGPATTDLDFALRARGVPRAARLWRHHLRQMLPLLRGRMQALCLVAPAFLIIIEDVLRFMGWGGWMAQAVRGADVRAMALCLLTGGVMMALLCAGFHLLLRGRLRQGRNRLTALAWLPWPLWMLGIMTLPPLSECPWLVFWFALLIFGSAAWHHAWTRVEKKLPLDAARVFGATEWGVWLAHIAPVQLRMLLAWISTVFAQTLLWIAAACVLQPRLVRDLEAPLGAWLGPLVVDSPQDTGRVLADPSTLLWAGGGLALAALCLIQISRIIQPRPS